MHTRRCLLRDSVAVAAASATAGCLFANGSETDRDVLADVVDTRPTVVPSFLTAYSCDPVALRDEFGGDRALPDVGRNWLSNVVANAGDTALEDVDRLAGQHGRDGGHSGGDLQVVRPAARHVLAAGSVDRDGATAWLDGLDATENLGANRGFDRYGTGGDVPEAFVVDDGHLGYGNRSGVDVEPADVAADAVDGTGEDAPVRDVAPPLAAVADEASGDAFWIATQFHLVAERPATDASAYDDVAASLLGAGAGASVDGSDCTVERLLYYRRDGAPSVDAVEAALSRAADDDRPLADADWRVRREDRTIVTTASIPLADLGDDLTRLRTVFPIPALEDVATPIDPRTLGRDAPPRVRWDPALTEDGELRIVHAGGPDVENVVVRYVADGESVEEQWSGPVATDDEFVTGQPPDTGTLIDLVWEPGTANETILLRVERPSSS